VVTAPVEAIDLTPTVLEVLGAPIPPEVTGRAVGRRPEASVRTAFADAFAGPVHAARKGPYLLQFSWGAANPVQLHDVVADPATRNNLYDPARPAPVARELWAVMREEILEVEPYVAADPRGYELALPPELESVPRGATSRTSSRP
jgi:arylsulfatase A-like enzyme